MDVKEWLEPSINKRIDAVMDICDIATKSIDNEFREAFNHLLLNYPNVNDILIEMNDLYFKRQIIIETAYRAGLSDGLLLVKNIWPGIIPGQ